MIEETGNIELAFSKGMNELKHKDVKEVRERLKKELGVTSDTGIAARICGRINHNIAERRAIEHILSEYGVTDIWGKA